MASKTISRGVVIQLSFLNPGIPAHYAQVFP
jgi:hypothetical protein